MALKPGQNSVIITYKNENTHEYIYFKIVKNFLMKIILLAYGNYRG